MAASRENPLPPTKTLRAKLKFQLKHLVNQSLVLINMISRPDWFSTPEERIVVVFDFYSSEMLLKEAARLGKMKHLVDFFDEVRDAMVEFKYERPRGDKVFPPIPFETYKFTGDGWILLFPKDTSPENLMTVLHHIANRYWSRFVRDLRREIQRIPRRMGLRFGVEKGVLYRFKWKHEEYVGAALVRAERLQNALKSEKLGPAKIMMSRECYRAFAKRSPNAFKRFRPKKLQHKLTKSQSKKTETCFELRVDVLWKKLLSIERRNRVAMELLSSRTA